MAWRAVLEAAQAEAIPARLAAQALQAKEMQAEPLHFLAELRPLAVVVVPALLVVMRPALPPAAAAQEQHLQ
jgi:hypothetical protein